MAELGARGVSILFASGESGYVPNLKYGASSPFVTAIGGVFNGDLGYDPLEADYFDWRSEFLGGKHYSRLPESLSK